MEAFRRLPGVFLRSNQENFALPLYYGCLLIALLGYCPFSFVRAGDTFRRVDDVVKTPIPYDLIGYVMQR